MESGHAQRTAAGEGVLHGRHGRTWYRVVGRSSGGRLPVVLCHGGPGLTHDYLLPLAALARTGRACVLYDQYGSGRSDHRPDAPREFWTPELFVEELAELVDHLGIADGFHLLGHSWGGLLAVESALTGPPGLRSLVLADAFASSATYIAEVGRLLGELPSPAREILERHRAGLPVDADDHRAAATAFNRRHVLRAGPPPAGLLRTMAALAADPTVYHAMMGESEFSMTGTLRSWDATARLGRIRVPALVAAGRHDQVTPRAVDELHRGLPRARRIEFADSGHLPHLEEPEAFRAAVEVFLAEVEGTPTG
ncbi:proline iminopeptidase-family hydrolase [Kitasatospora paranensis]|uniref:Proline iminopeptidase n=1 Tax=Kitasatospora paranensis TaxID=258053 RepID=A0ABW2G4N0_9ACTN